MERRRYTRPRRPEKLEPTRTPRLFHPCPRCSPGLATDPEHDWPCAPWVWEKEAHVYACDACNLRQQPWEMAVMVQPRYQEEFERYKRDVVAVRGGK